MFRVSLRALLHCALKKPQEPTGNLRISVDRDEGELERDVCKLGFEQVSILQPGPLVGERGRRRAGEGILDWMYTHRHRFGARSRFKPIHAADVAWAALELGRGAEGNGGIHRLDELEPLAKAARSRVQDRQGGIDVMDC